MTDAQPIEQAGSDRLASRAGTRFWLGCLAGCLLLAIAVSVAAYIAFVGTASTWDEESAAAVPTDPAASAPSATEMGPADQSTPSPTAPPPRQPAIMLTSTAVPATTEQLQQEAAAVADHLLTLYPELPAALHVVAMFHAQMRQSEQAEKYWSQCIELAPGNVRYYVNLGAIAMERGDSELAAETLQKALDADCTSPDLYHHLGVALTNLGRCDEAVQVIEKGLEAYSDFPSAWLVLGQAQLKLGRAEDAEASLRRAIEQGVRSPAAYFALAGACARQGKQEEAAEFRKVFAELKDSRKLDPQQRFEVLSSEEARRMTVSVLCEAAVVHTRQENSLEAERLLLRAIALDPSNVPSCRVLADLYRQSEMLREEQVVRRRLIRIEPLNLGNYLDLATVSAQLGQSETAEAALKQAVAIRPDAAYAYTTLAQFYLQSGKARHARWYAQEAVRREPTSERFVLLGSTCRLLGDEQAAESAFAEANRMKKDEAVRMKDEGQTTSDGGEGAENG